MRAVVPVAQLGRRMPQAGRIRAGRKTGPKGAPQALATFRFTSQDRAAIEQIAGLYGGDPVAWSDPKVAEGQWEVLTDAAEIRIALPPDPLGGTPIYELWSGGGCQRRCDGETCQTVGSGPDGGEMIDVPCICVAKGEMGCAVKTRLSVVLPDVKFAGVWRLDSSSWNVAHEMPGMVDMIRSLQDRGLTRGLLALEHRRTVTAGQTKKYIVPTLRVAETLDQLASGQAQVRSLTGGGAAGQAERAAIGQGDGQPDDHDLDDDVEVEEAVVELMADDAQVATCDELYAALTEAEQAVVQERMLADYGTASWHELTAAQAREVTGRLQTVMAGRGSR